MNRGSEEPSGQRGRGWLAGFATTLTLGMAVATWAQFAFGSLGPRLVEDLGLSRTQFGSLTTAFFVAGAILSPLVGPMTDRFGGRRLLLALFGVDAIAYLAMGAASSYALLLPAVLLAGVAVAGSNPSTNLLIAEHVPVGRRGLVVGIKQSGVQVASFIAGAAFPTLAHLFGWRFTIALIAGLAGIGMVVTLLVVPRDPPHASRISDAADGPVPAVRWLAAYALFMGAGISAVTAYVVLYAHEAVGVGEAAAGTLLAVIGGIGVIARILWSHDAERRATTAGPLAVLATLSIASIVLLLLAQIVGAWSLWLGAVVVGTSGAAWNSVGMLAIIRETGTRSAGRASGIVLTAFYIGLLVMPVGFGALVDATGVYVWSWLATIGVFVAALGVAVRWLKAEPAIQRSPTGGATDDASRHAAGDRPR